MAHTWFRFHNCAVEDPKVQRLPSHLFKFWVNCLCLASKHDGILPSVENLAFSLRVSERIAEECTQSLIACGLLDTAGETVSPHNWNGRQFISDVSTERVKRYRKRQRNVSETPPDTDSEQIQKTDTETISSEPSAPPLAAIELPTNKTGFSVSISQDDVAEFATLYPSVDIEKELRAMRGWLLSNPKNRKTATGMMKFVNAWLSKQQDRSKANGHDRPNAHQKFALGAKLAAEEFDRKFPNG